MTVVLPQPLSPTMPRERPCSRAKAHPLDGMQRGAILRQVVDGQVSDIQKVHARITGPLFPGRCLGLGQDSSPGHQRHHAPRIKEVMACAGGD